MFETNMYICLYEFPESRNLIYNLHFRLQQKHSTSHVLIYLTHKIREQMHKQNLGCGIFVDFQKAFDKIF